MPNTNWSQDVFSKGELSPMMYGRISVQQYYDGLKSAKNTITYPQGAIGKRFGTIKADLVENVLGPKYIFFQTFQYQNECVYLIVVQPGIIKIYLENNLLASVSVLQFDTSNIDSLDWTVIENRFRIAGYGFRPKDLVRSANPPNTITAFNSNRFTVTTAMTVDEVIPVRFSTTGTLPITFPQIRSDITYFARAETPNEVKIYRTSFDAAHLQNEFTLSSIGTGTNNLIPQNLWTVVDVAFKNIPIYDFNGGYDAITFTPAAVTGASVVLTASAPIFSAAFVGGAYVGNGGVARIISYTDPTHVVIAIEQPFDGTTAIAGKLSLLAEPAWSNTRGWPRKCSSYQNRAIFANSDSLTNGLWFSAINDYSDFNDMVADDDDAISWYPTSDDVNYIRFIVPYRSLTVHTNSGVYSNPLSFESAITPKTFSLQLQDSTPADVLKPRGIDNQIIVVSGNDVYSLVWEGVNNAYTSSIVSVMNEHLIRKPVDEAPYVDKRRAGSRYVFIINEDGTMAIYQTLMSQDISGWTPCVLEQSYGKAWFRQVASSLDGRCWFLTEREVAVGQAFIPVTAYDEQELTAVGSNFAIDKVTAVLFSAIALPSSSPAMEPNRFYWVRGINADRFKVYETQADAQAEDNALTFFNIGTDTNVFPYPLEKQWFIEELSFDVFTDCSVQYKGTPTNLLTGLQHANAQELAIRGDGFGFTAEGYGDEAVLFAHGEPAYVSEMFGGYRINTEITPMPLSIGVGGSIKTSNLTEPKHIRNARFMFANTIGGTINGVPIALTKLQNVVPGNPPIAARGVYELPIMKGWDDFNNPSFTIKHSEPYDIRLLGVFYVVDV